MGTINRAPFNALVDDDGSGLTGTVWNKAQIKSVILDPADAAYASQTPIYAQQGTATDPAYHNLLGVVLPPLTQLDSLQCLFQFQAGAGATSLQWFKGAAPIGALALPASTIAMGRTWIKQAAQQPTLVGMALESVLYPTNARSDGLTWTSTNEAWTAAWGLTLNCTGIPAGGVLYWSFAVYKLGGQ
jgi:hypothetical protein